MELISREEALKLVRKTSKYSHALVVSFIMGGVAERLGEDRGKWEVVGLLHDIDYDIVSGDMTKHGVAATEILKGRLPEDCLYAIKSHDHRTGFKPESRLAKSLVIADSLAVVIEKTGSDRTLSVEELEAGVERVSVEGPLLKMNLLRCREIGLSLSELLKLTVDSLKKDRV